MTAAFQQMLSQHIRPLLVGLCTILLAFFVLNSPAYSTPEDGQLGLPNAGGKKVDAMRVSGGMILLSAKTAGEILDHSTNLTGVKEVKSVDVKDGEIVFSGDHHDAPVTGKVDASKQKHSEAHGKMKTKFFI